MILKFIFILCTYQILNFMIQIAAAPSFSLALANISDTKYYAGENVIPRILTRSNGTHSEHFLSAINHYPDIPTYNQNIIFPDAFQLLLKQHLESGTTPRCATKDGHFCEEFEAYPRHHLHHVLLRTGKNSEFFGTDEEPIHIANRLGEPEETFICPSTAKTIFPKVGKNKDDVWKFIINQGEDESTHVQGIRIETCTQLDGPCNLLGNTPFGYVASCKQKFVLRRLLSVADNGQPIPDTFQIPSACCCSFKKDVVLTSENGRNNVSSKKRRSRD